MHIYMYIYKQVHIYTHISNQLKAQNLTQAMEITGAEGNIYIHICICVHIFI
jgi:hypothetical protein